MFKENFLYFVNKHINDDFLKKISDNWYLTLKLIEYKIRFDKIT